MLFPPKCVFIKAFEVWWAGAEPYFDYISWTSYAWPVIFVIMALVGNAPQLFGCD